MKNHHPNYVVKKYLIAIAALIALTGTAYAGTTNGLRPLNPQPQGVAPPLTSVAIYAVGSTQYGQYEYTYGKTSTTYDHGGMQLRVAVEEWGYAQAGYAKFQGGILPSSANYASDAICGGTPRNPDFSCPAGSIVVGWIEYYNLDGNSNGLFSFEASSINPPYNTYSAQIYIR
jgi:hypothetical protein